MTRTRSAHDHRLMDAGLTHGAAFYENPRHLTSKGWPGLAELVETLAGHQQKVRAVRADLRGNDDR
jgi:hypothetical protein